MKNLDKLQFDFVLESLLKEVSYLSNRLSKIERWLGQFVELPPEPVSKVNVEDTDRLLPQVIELLKDATSISASMIQRKLMVGYARASRILDELQEAGYVGEAQGSKPRKVLKKE